MTSNQLKSTGRPRLRAVLSRPAFLGLALCAAMFVNTLSEMGGPFTGLPRFALTLIAVVACRGEVWPTLPQPRHEPADPAAEPAPAA